MEEQIPQLTLTPNLDAEPQPVVQKEEDLITKAQAAPEAGPDLSALSAAEQKAVLDFAKQIDLENAQQILEYGASAQKNIADFSETALAKVKTSDLGEIGTMLSGLLVELKTMDEPEKKGIAGLFRKAKVNAAEMKSRYAAAEVNVDRISGELEKHKVTLMTVHSAKGLEFKYVYIVGMEENLFPSQRAAESPEGFEEERRLFYVALTRAKCSAVLSYAEMRFKWGNMEFSRPSCFLREIDPRYLDGAVGAGQTPVREEAAAGGRTALEELRRRFDVRYQQRAGGSGNPSFGGAKSSFGGRGGAYSGGSRPESGAPSFGGQGGTDSAFRRPALQRPVVPENLRRLGGGAAPAAGNAAASGYAVGERVEHPKFGCGEIVRIETLAADHKLVVVFEEYGEKTLLAKFAKLTKR